MHNSHNKVFTLNLLTSVFRTIVNISLLLLSLYYMNIRNIKHFEINLNILKVVYQDGRVEISLKGRLILLKSVLSSISLYIFFLLPGSLIIISSLESLFI